MTLPSPSPRSNFRKGRRFVPQVENKCYLPVPEAPAPKNFFDLLTSRRSTRTLNRLSEARLGELLWHATRVLEMTSPSSDYPMRKRPAPSAGGLQSQNILVQPAPESLFFYDPLAHSLGSLVNASDISPRLSELAMTVVPSREATVLWMAGDSELISNFYNDGESLLWRDSGCLAAVISLVAEALGIGVCLLGISGEPHLSKFFDGNLAGFGALLLGER